MTRAKSLLCLAIPKEHVNDEHIKDLEKIGWNIEILI